MTRLRCVVFVSFEVCRLCYRLNHWNTTIRLQHVCLIICVLSNEKWKDYFNAHFLGLKMKTPLKNKPAEEDENASRASQDPWGPHPSIHCSHCFHFFARFEKNERPRREKNDMNLFLPYLGSGFFSSSSILTLSSVPRCWSDLRQDSYHGNVEEKNINMSVRLQQLKREREREIERARERPSQAKLECSRLTEKRGSQWESTSKVSDSCHSQSECARAWQTHLWRYSNGMCC